MGLCFGSWFVFCFLYPANWAWGSCVVVISLSKQTMIIYLNSVVSDHLVLNCYLSVVEMILVEMLANYLCYGVLQMWILILLFAQKSENSCIEIRPIRLLRTIECRITR